MLENLKVAQIKKFKKISPCIFELFLGGPSPLSQLVSNPFNWSPNTVFYRYLSIGRSNKKNEKNNIHLFALLHFFCSFFLSVFLKCIFPKCIYPKCIFAKCTWLVCLLSFASLFWFSNDFLKLHLHTFRRLTSSLAIQLNIWRRNPLSSVKHPCRSY